MCMRVFVYAMYVQGPTVAEEGARSLEQELYRRLDVGAGTRTWVFYKSGKHSYPLSHHYSPLITFTSNRIKVFHSLGKHHESLC